MFKSLKTELLFYFFIVNILILFGFSFFIYTTAQSGVLKNLDSKLKILSQDAIVDLVKDKNFEAKEIARDLSKEFQVSPLHVKIIYYNSNTNKIEQEHISSSSLEKIFSIPLNERSKLNDIYYFNRDEFRVSSMFLDKVNKNKIFFQLATHKIVSSPYLQELKLSLFIAVPIILILFLLIVSFLINKTLKPVRNVIYSVNEISTQNLSKRVSDENIPIEIKELVSTFNKLLSNIEESFTRISTFSSDASHELKTPLTVIRGEIEIALRKQRDSKEYKEVLENILEEFVLIEETINHLFLLSKKDTIEFNANDEEFYFDELISDVVDNLKKLSEAKRIKLYRDSLVPLTLNANESLLKVALSNLVKNAIFYTKEDGEVHISLEQNKQTYILKIKDNGCGISKQDLPFIFDRFFRVDKARSRENKGTGLGLSIVKMILDIYQYDIEVISELEVGTTVLVKFNMNKM